MTHCSGRNQPCLEGCRSFAGEGCLRDKQPSLHTPAVAAAIAESATAKLAFAETAAASGKKLDQGKTMHHLIPPIARKAVAAVMAFGAAKYGKHNWMGGMPHTRLYDAANRHLDDWLEGQDDDEESKLPHLWHALCCIVFLVWMAKFRPDLDDRRKPNEEREA